MPAILQPVCEFARGGGLARALQPRHEHDRGRLRGELELGRVLAQHRDHFVAHNLDDLLARGKRRQHFLPHGLCLDLVNEQLDHLEVNVGFQQRQPDLAQRLLDVFRGKRGLAA